MRLTCGVHVVWCHFVPEPSTSFSLSSVINVVTTPSDVTDVTVWPITSNPNPRVLKIEKIKDKLKRK